MRLLHAFSLPSALALLAAALLLTAGCDSGGGPPGDIGQNTTFSFRPPADTAAENGFATYTVDVQLNDPGHEAKSVQVSFDADASTLSRSDFDGLFDGDTTLSFPQSATDGDAQTLSFSLDDDVRGEMSDSGETVVLALQNPEGGTLGEGTYTLRFREVSIAEARGQSLDTEVATEGVLTRVEGSNVRIQDQSGVTGASGIVVRSDPLAAALDSGAVALGDRIEATGTLGAFNGLLQLGGDVFFSVTESGAGLPDAQDASISELVANGEDYESELVRIDDLEIIPQGSQGFEAGTNYDVTDAPGDTLTLRIPDGSFYDGLAIPSGEATFRGVFGQFNGAGSGAIDPDTGYQIFAIEEGDIVEE